MFNILLTLAACITPHPCFNETTRAEQEAPDDLEVPTTLHYFEGGTLTAYDTQNDDWYEPADLTQTLIQNENNYFSGTGITFSLNDEIRYDHSCEETGWGPNSFLNNAEGLAASLNVYLCEPYYMPVNANKLSITRGLAKNDQGRFMVDARSATESTTAHETGHAFGLFHTFETRSGAEKIDGSNEQTAGDLISDTPADPGDCEIDFDSDPPSLLCPEDSHGQTYEPLGNNLMNYYNEYMDEFPAFTPEQGDVMRCVVDTELAFWD